MFGVERQVCQTKAMSQQFLKQRRCHDNFDIDILGCAVINDMQLVLSIVNTCPTSAFNQLSQNGKQHLLF